MTAFKLRDPDGHPLELLAFPEGHVPGEWRSMNPASPFLGIDHTALAIGDSAISADFFSSVFGFTIGSRTENRGPEQANLDDVEDVHVSVTRLGPDGPVPRLELLRYHVGTHRPIPPGTASSDIVATHCVLRVASLGATLAALARRGTPLTSDDMMNLHGVYPLPWYRDQMGIASWWKSRQRVHRGPADRPNQGERAAGA